MHCLIIIRVRPEKFIVERCWSFAMRQFIYTMHLGTISLSGSDRVKETKGKLHVYFIFRFTCVDGDVDFKSPFRLLLSIHVRQRRRRRWWHYIFFFVVLSFFCRSNFSAFSDDWNFREVSALVSLNLANYRSFALHQHMHTRPELNGRMVKWYMAAYG